MIAGGASDERPVQRRGSAVVLIVDDHADTREMYAQFLAAMGLKTVEATTCADALAKTAATRFDAVVLDRRLPDGDGAEVGRALKSDPRTRAIPVIVISGRDQDRPVEADAYLLKPVIPETLLQEIERLTARPR